MYSAPFQPLLHLESLHYLFQIEVFVEFQPRSGTKLKSVSKVLGKMSDSRTSYIAQVTIVQRADNAMPQLYYAIKCYQCCIQAPSGGHFLS